MSQQHTRTHARTHTRTHTHARTPVLILLNQIHPAIAWTHTLPKPNQTPTTHSNKHIFIFNCDQQSVSVTSWTWLASFHHFHASFFVLVTPLSSAVLRPFQCDSANSSSSSIEWSRSSPVRGCIAVKNSLTNKHWVLSVPLAFHVFHALSRLLVVPA